jgi:broad specificity phosphatase PhoE
MADIWLARHGETEWTVSRRHTSRTDLDLTARGEQQAVALGERLRSESFALVLSSPAIRARRTAELAGFGAELEPLFSEYDYGEYEGLTTVEIKRERPEWDLWRDGCPGGEQTADVALRADQVLERLRRADGGVLTFGHGHMTRVLAARALGLEGETGRYLMLGTATLSLVGSEHGRPAIALWNDSSHLRG